MRIVGRRGPLGDALTDILTGGVTAAASGSVLQGLASVYDTLEVRTAVTPPAVVNLHSVADPNSPPSPVVEFLRPTIILTGPGGQEVIAPYGVAPDGTAGTLGAVLFLMGVGFGLGYYFRSRKGKGGL